MNNGKMNILLCFDDADGNYSRHAAVTILSLLETNQKNKIKVWILSSSLSQENINELKRIVNSYNQEIEFIIDDNIITDKLKKIIINRRSLTRGARYRLFFPRFIKGIDRILYIDCDVLIKKDISKIYNMDMHGKSIAGYYDLFPGRCKNKIFGTKYYINSGVMLFDANKYDVNKINLEKMVDINHKYGKYFNGADQDKINLIFKDDIIIGNKGMNYIVNNKWFLKGIKKAEIIHCIEKPYVQYSNIPQKIKNEYNMYLDKTKRKGFPEEESEYSYIQALYSKLISFIFNLGISLLGDNLFEKLVLFKRKIQDYKSVNFENLKEY